MMMVVTIMEIIRMVRSTTQTIYSQMNKILIVQKIPLITKDMIPMRMAPIFLTEGQENGYLQSNHDSKVEMTGTERQGVGMNN